MKIHHLRNATMVIESQDKVLLIDPLIGPKGHMPTLTLFRFKAQKNPIVGFPEVGKALLEKVTHCLITHPHPDHLDPEGIKFLKQKNIPVYCSINDETAFRKLGLNVVQSFDYWQKTAFLGGSIMGTPALHGYGYIAKPMGKVMGYLIELPGEPSVYLSSDTIYTDEVHKVLTAYKPEIAVAACGSAQLDIFKPLLMDMKDILKFVEHAPAKVIANHMEAVNHCPTTRAQLATELNQKGLREKVWIPADGESADF